MYPVDDVLENVRVVDVVFAGVEVQPDEPGFSRRHRQYGVAKSLRHFVQHFAFDESLLRVQQKLVDHYGKKKHDNGTTTGTRGDDRMLSVIDRQSPYLQTQLCMS